MYSRDDKVEAAGVNRELAVGKSQIVDTSTIRKSLSNATKDGVFYSIMVHFGEAFVQLFALFLKATNTQIGLITALPQLIGTSCNALSVEVVDRLKKRKLISVVSASLQGIVWLPMCLSVFLPSGVAIYVLLVSMIVYVSAFNFSVPPYLSMLGDLVPADERGKYFGRRSMLTIVISLPTFFIAGYILDIWKLAGYEYLGFLSIFAVAFLARTVSVVYINSIYEPPYIVQEKDRFSLWDFIRRYPDSNFARFTFYTAIIRMCACTAGPYFAIYMMRDLKFSYIEFTVVTIVAEITRAVAMPYWGKLSDRIGNKMIIKFTGIGVSIVPFVWLIYPSIWCVLIAEAYSGIVWAGFELATGNFLFDSVTPQKRARCSAYYNLLNGYGVFVGAIVGGLLADKLPSSVSLLGNRIDLLSSLQIIIFGSGILRLVSSVLLISTFKEPRSNIIPIGAKDLFLHWIRIKHNINLE